MDMSTSTLGWTVGKGVAVLALAGATLAGLGGCDQGTAAAPPGGAAAGNNAGPAAVQNQVGQGGPLGNMRDNPTSYFGRTAKQGKDTVQMAINRDAAIGGMAAEMSGEAEPLDIAGLRWSVPTEWEKVRSPGAMRAAEYRIPHTEGGDGEAQIVWFYFGPNQGGTIEDNIARWAGLVRDVQGNPTMPDIATMKINGIPAVLVAMNGTYRDGIPGQTYVERPDYGFRGAIFSGPKGNVFIRLTGPVDLIDAIIAQWQNLFQGTRPDNM